MPRIDGCCGANLGHSRKVAVRSTVAVTTIGRFVKSRLDRSLALVGLVLLSPPLAIIALCIWVTPPAPHSSSRYGSVVEASHSSFGSSGPSRQRSVSKTWRR